MAVNCNGQICGLDRQTSVDATERALRAELGWLWNECDSEWVTDLEHVAAHPLPKPSKADRETHQALLALIGNGPSDEKPQLEKRIAASELLPHTEKYRRYGICEALGEVGVMPNALVRPSRDGFTTVADLWAASPQSEGRAALRRGVALRRLAGRAWGRLEAREGFVRREASCSARGRERAMRLASRGRTRMIDSCVVRRPKA